MYIAFKYKVIGFNTDAIKITEAQDAQSKMFLSTCTSGLVFQNYR